MSVPLGLLGSFEVEAENLGLGPQLGEAVAIDGAAILGGDGRP
jgi:hypothetical protein